MIYYFSGTGNSRWVARQLAGLTLDTAADLTRIQPPVSVDGQVLGIVFPIYAWGVPEPVLEFVQGLSGTPVHAYAVCTCGDEAGRAMEHLNNLLPLDSAWSIAMPSNYIIGADTESDASIDRKISRAAKRLPLIAEAVRSRQQVFDVMPGRFAAVKSGLVCPAFNRFARSTRPFHATEKCIGCGQCAELCPAGTIHLIDGKPQWREKCFQCTACINRCPVEAIEYGKGTRHRRRYTFEAHWREKTQS